METITLLSKPSVTIDEAKTFLLEKWNFLQIIEIEELLSYNCRTYLVATTNTKYIFKIVNEKEPLNESYFEALEKMLTFLEVCNVPAQRLVKSTFDGKAILNFPYIFLHRATEHKKTSKAYLLTYIKGTLLNSLKITPELCFNVGRELNLFTKKVDELEPKSMFLENTPQDSIWRLDSVLMIKPLIPYMKTVYQQHLLTKAVNRFEDSLMPQLEKLTKGFIHGDPNEGNIIITKNNTICFIDWEDIGYSYKVYDLAILIFSILQCNYNFLTDLNIENIGKYCLQGYISADVLSLSEKDIELLANVIEARITISLSVGQYTYTNLNPYNEYLLTSAKVGWAILENLLEKRDEYTKKWKLI